MEQRCVVGRIGPGPFDEFWSAYPKQGRVGKKLAAVKWRAAVDEVSERFGGDVGAASRFIAERAAEYAVSGIVRRGYAKHATTWLNQGCYDDDAAAWNVKPVSDTLSPPVHAMPDFKPKPVKPMTPDERAEVKGLFSAFRRGRSSESTTPE